MLGLQLALERPLRMAFRAKSIGSDELEKRRWAIRVEATNIGPIRTLKVARIRSACGMLWFQSRLFLPLGIH